jgi:P pilus assembly chaperone PapD
VINDLILPLSIAVISPIFTAVISAKLLGLKRRREQPFAIAKRLDELKDKVDSINDAIRTSFMIQDKLFEATMKQNGGIRELSRSVCNGNKEEALKMCDDADNLCEEGIKIQKEYLLKR